MGFALWFGRTGNGGIHGGRGEHPIRRETNPAPSSIPLPESDAALIVRIQGGEEHAFDLMFRQYYVSLCEYALTRGADTGQAEDIVSEIFTTVWEQRATWSPAVGIGPYLFRAVRNRVVNVLRNSARAEAREMVIATELPFVPHADAETEAQERAKMLAHALILLSPRRKLLVQLRWGQQLSYPEIALRLGITTAAVQMQMTRLLDALRRQLPDDFV